VNPNLKWMNMKYLLSKVSIDKYNLINIVNINETYNKI